MAVGSQHIAGDGHGGVVADADVAGDGRGGGTLGDGVAHPHAVLSATGEGSPDAGAHPDVEPLRLACAPQLHEVELHAELRVVCVHEIVAIGLGGRRGLVEHREALLSAVAHPEVVGTNTHPGADGEVDTATHGGRQFVTLLGIVVGVPHSRGPRQSPLGIDAPGMGAQLLVAVARGRGHGVLGLRLDTRDGEHHEPQAERGSCPSATRERHGRIGRSCVHTCLHLGLFSTGLYIRYVFLSYNYT